MNMMINGYGPAAVLDITTYTTRKRCAYGGSCMGPPACIAQRPYGYY